MFKNGMIWVVLSVLFSAGLQGSEKPFFSFTAADFSKQLSQKTVRQVYQDSTGYLWFVTQEGLSRYDGYQLLNFSHDPSQSNSISSDNVRTIVEDKQKRLWIATDGGGLNLFNPADHTFTLLREGGNRLESPMSDKIRSLYLAQGGDIWLGYNNGNFSRFDPENNKFTHFETRSLLSSIKQDAFITSITEDAGNIYLATDGNGLLILGKSDYLLSHIHSESEKPLFSNRLTNAYVDSAQRLWLASYDAGVSQLDFVRNTYISWHHDDSRESSIASNLVHTIFQDQQHRIWLGTEEGLSLWNAQNKFTNFSEKSGVSNNKVLSILQDPSGLMWIGTYGGITKGIEVPFELIDKGLASNTVLGFAETHSSSGIRSIWVASYKGLSQLNSNGVVMQVLNTESSPPLKDPRIMTVRGDNNILWFGTRGSGLGRLNVDTQKLEYFQHDAKDPNSISFDGISSILPDKQGNLWVGTFGGGLNFLPANSKEFKHFRYEANNSNTLNSDRVVALWRLQDGMLVVGTVSGLNVFDPVTSTFKRIEHQQDKLESLSAPTAWAFYQDHDENLWVGSQGGGLNQWRKEDVSALKNRFTHFDKRSGLPSSHIYSIQGDESGSLWLSSTAGITRFNPNNGTMRHFDSSQGIEDSEFNFGAGFTDSQGIMYFGGNSGLVRFHPNEIKESKKVPPVVLVRIKKLNEKIGVDVRYQEQNEIVLHYLDYYISFEFAALDFNAPELNQYRYKLEGLDPKWVELDHSRQATFTNLPAGQYELKVQASNHLGLWNSHGVSLPITVLPPPWKTTWAYCFYTFLCIVILLNAMRRYRLKRLRRAQHLIDLEDKVKERTADLRLANDKLEQISFTDPLTGLKNRRYLSQNLTADIDFVLARYEEHLATGAAQAMKDTDLVFFLVDLDHFKHVNDQYGHSAGDSVLVEVKSILESVFRETDYLLRWGGEEFLIVARFVNRSRAVILAERLRRSIQEHSFKVEKDIVLNVTCSIGFSVFPLLSSNPTSHNWERTIDVADLCLYAAKKSNRNTWIGFTDLTCDEQDVFSAVIDKTESLISSGQLMLASSIDEVDKIQWR